MTDQTTAVAKREEAPLAYPPLEVTSVAGRNDVERIETIVTLPAAFQYAIKTGRVQTASGWQDKNKVGITADGYDYLNRSMGLTFFLPDFVPDKSGNLARNPVRTGNYILIRMGAVWYNEVGQMVGAVEDLEVDYEAVYQAARLRQPGATIVLDTNGQPVFDEKTGHPAIIMRDHTSNYDNKSKTTTAAEQEKRAVEALMQLRSTGERYAQTVVRVRLLKQALGVRSLPINAPRDIRLKVVGYRDQMDPREREEKAKAQMSGLFGRPVEVKPLPHDMLDQIERDVVLDDNDAEQAIEGGTVSIADDDREFDVPPPPDEN